MSRVDNFIELWPEFILRLVFIFVRLFNHSFKIYIKKKGKKYAHTRSFYL